jgi:adenosylhomocysteine nucleosidase
MKTIAILAPMQEELDAVIRLLPAGKTEHLHGLDLTRIDYCDKHLVLARSGVGKVNTAMSVAILLSHLNVDHIVNLGSAGGMRAGQHILDLVVPSEVLAVDVDVTPLGFAFGQMLGEPSVYHTDAAMRDWFQKASQAWPEMPTVHHGAVGTTDSFIYRPDQVELIQQRFGEGRVACAEMEGAAVAQVCHRFGVPFLIVRSLSDVPATDANNHLDFNEFLHQAAHNAARLLVEMLKSDVSM